MRSDASRPADLPVVHRRVLGWYAEHARDLPWRRHDASPWGVFVSEVMAQQTPLARVEPSWREWMARWPMPAALAAEAPGEAVRAWKRLGYPRRALWLHQAATVMVARHGGRVPSTVDALRALPGVGEYTAAAVACFAYGIPEPVLDTNVRRLLTRVLTGAEHAMPSVTGPERRLAAMAMPADRHDATTWNVAAMELGALVCTARNPDCRGCPVAPQCAWHNAGRPAYAGPDRRRQSWAGTDRQVRGALLQMLRDSPGPVTADRLTTAWPSAPAQRQRCLDSLLADGLVQHVGAQGYRLPA
ncbi:MAG: A/G-specific adenine glycosylase [Dermatophilaceae bacterium]